MRIRLAVICLLAMALALPGCNGSELECHDSLGCLLVRPGEPISIALMLSLSGEAAFLGEDSRGGVEIAVNDWGDRLLEHPIELVIIDSGCSEEQGQHVTEFIMADTGLAGIIGPNCSDAARTLAPAVQEAGLVMISPSATAPELTEVKEARETGYFRTAHNNLLQAQLAAEYAYDVLGARRAAVVYDESDYAEGLRRHFIGVFQDLGGSITFDGMPGSGPAEMAETLSLIAAGSPDVLYLPAFEPTAARVISRLGEVEGLRDPALIGADGLLVDTLPGSLGEAANGIYLSGPAVTGTAYEAFLNKWRVRYGVAPPAAFHAHAYDATGILLDAIEMVAQVGRNGALLIGRQALREAIAATEGYDGLTGTLSCRPSGDCASGEALGIFQITGEEVAGANWPPPVVWIMNGD